jgi:hypothetical protein
MPNFIVNLLIAALKVFHGRNRQGCIEHRFQTATPEGTM